MRVAVTAGVALLLLFAGAGCAARGSRSFDSHRLENEAGWISATGVPLLQQRTETDCGAAALGMVLAHWKSESFDPATVPDGRMKAGYMRDLAKAHGFQAFLVSSSIAEIETQLAKDRPLIVGLVKPRRIGAALTHYEVVVAIHPQRKRVVTLDPAHGWRETTVEKFLVEWEHTKRLALIAFPSPSTPRLSATEGSAP